VGHRAYVPAAGGFAELAEVIAGLAASGVVVDEIGVRRPTLDEVFLTLTGEDSAALAMAGHVSDGSQS
jgi:ABC-2 type transport system ATP-binding protein